VEEKRSVAVESATRRLATGKMVAVGETATCRVLNVAQT